MLANPWMLLGGLLALVASGAGGYNVGARAARADALARVTAAQDATVAAANQRAQAELQRAVAAAQAEARTQTRVRVVKQEVIRHVVDRVECRLPDADLERLRQLVAAANADPPTDAGGVPDPVPADSAADGR